MEQEKQHLSLLNKGNHGYQLAYKLACEQLSKIKDIKQQCLKSAAQYHITDSQITIIIHYLNHPYTITLPEITISRKDCEEEIPIREKILILHYLTQAKGTQPSKRIIAYQQLPEGIVYFPTFSKRTIIPLLDYFGSEPQRLLDIARLLGGYQVDYGDIAVTIDAFNRVSIMLVIWSGDEEFDPRGSIMFDSTISDYLTTDDINVLCEIITWKLVKLLKA
ncbi:DUF3786 domain-containing protein [Chloroflexota bacterium]